MNIVSPDCRCHLSVECLMVSLVTSFAVDGPQVWNSLSTKLKQSGSLVQFKWRLKTHLFGYGPGDFLYVLTCLLIRSAMQCSDISTYLAFPDIC